MTPYSRDLKYSIISISIFFARLIQHMDNTFGHFVDTSPRATLSAMRDISDVNVRLLFFIYNCFSNIYSFKPILCTYIHFVKGIPILTIVNRALVSRRLSCVWMPWIPRDHGLFWVYPNKSIFSWRKPVKYVTGLLIKKGRIFCHSQRKN